MFLKRNEDVCLSAPVFLETDPESPNTSTQLPQIAMTQVPIQVTVDTDPRFGVLYAIRDETAEATVNGSKSGWLDVGACIWWGSGEWGRFTTRLAESANIQTPQ